jgi:hypothetical protein
MTMGYQYSFKDVLSRAERITWRVEDIIGGEKKLDFSKPFMPESFARCEPLDFLSAKEKLQLNQIRGHAYLTIFGLVEEWILPFVLDHARPFINGEDYRARAFLEFASEEAKHIHLFRVFEDEFVKGCGLECQVIGPPEAIGKHVLSHPPLSVALLTLMIEWMTQKHFQESVKDNAEMDPLFKSLLLHHWQEEHQHAQLDAIMVEQIAENLSPAEIDAGIEGFLALGAFLDGGLKQQAMLDMAALEKATGRQFNEAQRAKFIDVQHQANRWTYIGSGMDHPKFLETLQKLSPERRTMIEQAAPSFC